jgi:hypothetical protein
MNAFIVVPVVEEDIYHILAVSAAGSRYRRGAESVLHGTANET